MDVRRKNLLGGVYNTPLQRVRAWMAERDEDAGGGSSVHNILYTHTHTLSLSLTHTQVITHDHMSPNQVITGMFQDVRRKNLLGQRGKPLPPLRSTPAIDHIPLYSPLYGCVQREGRVSLSLLSLSPLCTLVLTPWQPATR